MNKRLWMLGLVITLTGTLGCGADSDGETADDDLTSRTGMNLTVDLDGDTDVSFIRFSIERVSCDNEVFEPFSTEFVTDLEDLSLPGMISEFEDNPLDQDSSHIFADQFTVLAAGCYDVTITPLNAQEEPSGECRAATQEGVEVEDGLTTEIVLVSQCDGPENGALDAVAALNHPPTIVSMTFEPSKFVFECEMVELCVTAIDPDQDPLEFEWAKLNGSNLHDGFTVLSTETSPDGSVTQCVGLTPRFTGGYGFDVTVYDLAQSDNGTVRFEQWLAEQGYPAESRDSLEFPLYVNWDIEFQCYDPATDTYAQLGGARTIDRAPGCSWTTPAEFYCNPGYVGDDVAYYCPGGTFDPTSVYPSCQ